MAEETKWVDEEDDGESSYPPDYDVISIPNDFNVNTLFDLITQNIIQLPTFQRYFVWDIKRASKFIESLIMGLPVPEIFLYEEAKNKFSVIDGQQRLSTIYYFKSSRFPLKERVAELRKIFDENGKIPDSIFQDNTFFGNFTLKLDTEPLNSRLNGLNYQTLDTEERRKLDLRPIRTITIRQIKPEDESASYEIFSRLNSGGVNLKPQEIRSSLYHSKFMDALKKLNSNSTWRGLTTVYPDSRMRDIEIILRGIAMLAAGERYTPSMVRFLNKFSEGAKQYNEQKVRYITDLFTEFMEKCRDLPNDAFKINGLFNVSLYEAVFVAVCKQAYQANNLEIPQVDVRRLKALKDDKEFKGAIESQTTDTKNVKIRIKRASEILLG